MCARIDHARFLLHNFKVAIAISHVKLTSNCSQSICGHGHAESLAMGRREPRRLKNRLTTNNYSQAPPDPLPICSTIQCQTLLRTHVCQRGSRSPHRVVSAGISVCKIRKHAANTCCFDPLSATTSLRAFLLPTFKGVVLRIR